MKNLLAVMFLLSLPFLVSAQGNNGRRGDIDSYRVNYLKEKLELSPEEAKVFWPLYNSWQSEHSALRNERREKMISFRKITEIENLSDTQVQNLIDNELNFKQRDLDIEKKYYGRLKSSLPIKTIGKYYRAQETFKRELLNRYKDGKHN